MKKRLLALLLALVLMLSMLPTALALDADEPAETTDAAETEQPTEGKTEEQPGAPEAPEQLGEPEEEPEEEPEQAAEPEEAEKPAAEEAEVAAFAADTSGAEAYLMGVRLQNGYYKTIAATNSSLKMDENTYSEDVPTGWYRYLHYENGTLTVVGTVDAAYSGKDAVLRVESGTLTVDGAGALSLSGTDTTALYVKENSTADVVFDFTPSTSGQQLSIHSSGAVAVSGDLTIDNAGTIWIESKPSLTPSEDDTKRLYDTIDGNAYINATNVSIMNTAGGSCVNGNITLANAKLMISSEPIGDTGAMSPVAAVSNCSLEMTNSSFWVKGSNSSWDKFTILDNAYEWYVGKSELDNKAFISSKTEKFTVQKANDHPFFWIRSGDKMEPSDTPAERKAELTAAYPIAASAGKPVTFHASVRLTGETLNVQDIDGYGWMFDYFEEGVQYSRYGIPYQTDLTGYITLETPVGGTWTITAAWCGPCRRIPT